MMELPLPSIERLLRMDHTPTGIESELLDLSNSDVATLRSIRGGSIDAAIDRVRATVTDAEGRISGYNGSFSDRMRPTGSESEDRAG
ncbi:hypothetical protein GCM10009557_41650 [Virgisporangium ochraceum]|uniref:Uncharacterized protein n=2 Tax=Virgisporangium ochraceum TaxID=65505 RepID=A0A8J4EHG2_9ACTN|nr:hypothetical protein Voc01_096130 [Virgisporangium ochraceum]